MNQTMECGEARISLGVYVLGAIDPAERAMVDAHLATCSDCREELAGLAGLPALLARVSREDALLLGEGDPADEPPHEALSLGEAPQAPPELLGTVLDLAAARRRRRSWRNGLLAAAAAAVVAVGSFAGTHYLTVKPASSSAAGCSRTGDCANFGTGGAWDTASVITKTGQGAWIKYRAMGWGLQIDSRVVGIPVGTECDLYVITKDGKRLVASSWITDTNESNVWYSGAAAAMDSNVTSFEITTSGRTPPVIVPMHPSA
jgi:hypothetical protein